MESKICDLGWCVARYSSMFAYPKQKLELFSPDSQDAEGRYVPRSDIQLTEGQIAKLRDFLNECFPKEQ